MMLDVFPNSCDIIKQNNNEFIYNDTIYPSTITVHTPLAMYQTNIKYYLMTKTFSNYTNVHC